MNRMFYDCHSSPSVPSASGHLNEITGGKELEFDHLRRQSGTVASSSDLNQKVFRTVKGLGVGYLKRYGDSGEDTDNSDAEDARGRTAHHLFADDTAAGNGLLALSQSMNLPQMLPITFAVGY
jgi:hypothetical protein